MAARGLRNNNPLNIRRSKDHWRGQCPQQTDPAFCQFESLEYGWRAAFVLLTSSYYQRHHLRTLRAIITRWAPPVENDTAAYITYVAHHTGFDPDALLPSPSASPATWQSIATVMSLRECGLHPINYEAMRRGWEMAMSP